MVENVHNKIAALLFRATVRHMVERELKELLPLLEEAAEDMESDEVVDSLLALVRRKLAR